MIRRTLLAVLAAGALALVPGAPAHAASTGCGDLSAGAARTEGQRFMERMLGSTRAREAMDRTMAAMMGVEGVQQAHEMMGRSAKGCPAGDVPAGMARMMGAMAGMMGGDDRGMMGGPGDGDTDTGEIVMIVLMTLLAAAALAAVVLMLTRRSGHTPTAPGPHSEPTPGT